MMQGDSVFSDAEGEIERLEAEIANQTREIAAFIESHGQQPSASTRYQVLKDLYDIFTKQVSINMPLRRQIVSMRFQDKPSGASVKQFITDIEVASGRTFTDLNAVANYISSAMTRSVDEKRSASELVEFDNQRNVLHREMSGSEAESENLQKQIIDVNAEFTMLLADLKARTENAAITSAGMRLQIAEENDQRLRLIREIDFSVDGGRTYRQKIDERETSTKETMEVFRELHEKRTVKISGLNERISGLESAYARVSDETTGLDAAIKRAKADLTIAAKKTAEEIRELGRKTRIVCDDLARETQRLDDISVEVQIRTSERESLMQRKQEREQIMNEQRTRLADTKGKVRGLRNLERELVTEIEERKAHFERILKSSPEMFDDAIAQSMRRNEEVLVENKRLESKLRVVNNDIRKLKKSNVKIGGMLREREMRHGNCPVHHSNPVHKCERTVGQDGCPIHNCC